MSIPDNGARGEEGCKAWSVQLRQTEFYNALRRNGNDRHYSDFLKNRIKKINYGKQIQVQTRILMVENF